MGLGSKKVKDSGGLSAWNDDPKKEVKDVARRARRAHDDRAIKDGLEDARAEKGG
jgi:hypothetical protein